MAETSEPALLDRCGYGRTTGPVALDEPNTRRALIGYRRSALLTFAVGITVLLVGMLAGLVPTSPKGFWPSIGTLVFGVGGFATVVGVGLSGRSLRIARLLARRTMVLRHCSYRIAPRGGNGQPALLVHANATADEAVCSVSAFVGKYRRIEQGDYDMRIVGDPTRWAVLINGPTDELVVIKRPWNRMWGRALKKHAAVPPG